MENIIIMPKNKNHIRFKGTNYEVIGKLKLDGHVYIIIEDFSNGNNSDHGVYKAIEPKMDRMTVIRWKKGSNYEERRLLHRAAENNPNLPTVLYHKKKAGKSYIVLPWIHGRSLRWYIDKAKQGKDQYRFHPEDAFHMTRKLTHGLLNLHRNRIIHGDLKPENLIVQKPFRMIPIDFGISWTGEKANKRDYKSKTRRYCAPEQFKGGLVDSRADQFSISVVLYEMITLKLPYDDYGSEAARYSSPKLKSSKKTNKASWSKLDTVLKRSLNLDPNKRYQTTQDFLNALISASPKSKKYTFSPLDKFIIKILKNLKLLN